MRSIQRVARLLIVGLLAGTLRSASIRHRASGPSDAALAALVAQVDRIDPALAGELQWVSRSVVAMVEMLVGMLERFRALEGRLDHARELVEDDSVTPVDDELFNRLAEQLQVWPVREALQRLQDAHPDAPDAGHDHQQPQG